MSDSIEQPAQASAPVRNITMLRLVAAGLALGLLALIPPASFAAMMSLMAFDAPGSDSDPATIAAVIAVFLFTGLLAPALLSALWALFRPKRSLILWSIGLAAPGVLVLAWLLYPLVIW